MSDLALNPTTTQRIEPDLEFELAETQKLLAERKAELSVLQDQFHEFKTRYTRIVGAPLAELAEIEDAVRLAEEKVLGIGKHPLNGEDVVSDVVQDLPKRTSLKKLFWSVARMFHPDHAADDSEARRRHSVMAEANRAYRDGDFESLETLLGDKELRLYCTTGPVQEQSLVEQVWSLKDELRTIEFGIKRIKQDRLYQIKLSVDREAAEGRDSLSTMADSIRRQIGKARRRLQHLS
jgi:hypothetical protein